MCAEVFDRSRKKRVALRFRLLEYFSPLAVRANVTPPETKKSPRPSWLRDRRVDGSLNNEGNGDEALCLRSFLPGGIDN